MRRLFRRSRSTRPTVEDHRAYVGGLWDEVGRLQFDFMVERGLRPGHVLVDVACGSLRGGVHFIRYLDPGNYLGIDLEASLIEAGLEQELDAETVAAKAPEFVVSDSFEFDRFSKRPDFGLAQSLFSHLVADDIALCLSRLRASVSPGHRFFATFNAGPSGDNPRVSDSHGYFAYPTEELAAVGRDAGWDARPFGPWGHPRGQHMMEFVAV